MKKGSKVYGHQRTSQIRVFRGQTLAKLRNNNKKRSSVSSPQLLRQKLKFRPCWTLSLSEQKYFARDSLYIYISNSAIERATMCIYVYTLSVFTHTFAKWEWLWSAPSIKMQNKLSFQVAYLQGKEHSVNFILWASDLHNDRMSSVNERLHAERSRVPCSRQRNARPSASVAWHFVASRRVAQLAARPSVFQTSGAANDTEICPRVQPLRCVGVASRSHLVAKFDAVASSAWAQILYESSLFISSAFCERASGLKTAHSALMPNLKATTRKYLVYPSVS